MFGWHAVRRDDDDDDEVVFEVLLLFVWCCGVAVARLLRAGRHLLCVLLRWCAVCWCGGLSGGGVIGRT
ncbi:unnamed protein product [Anisakis simplex]|uniref:Secreted peptide n=1 Tax=Anisakis simplex TaxID=6269 RepID=A0A0M3JEL7_ANISI|nr:unnamed protein product [Anisakis simplex]